MIPPLKCIGAEISNVKWFLNTDLAICCYTNVLHMYLRTTEEGDYCIRKYEQEWSTQRNIPALHVLNYLPPHMQVDYLKFSA